MTHNDFMLKIAELNLELSKAIIINDFPNIEYWSYRVGKLIVKYLNENKLHVKN